MVQSRIINNLCLVRSSLVKPTVKPLGENIQNGSRHLHKNKQTEQDKINDSRSNNNTNRSTMFYTTKDWKLLKTKKSASTTHDYHRFPGLAAGACWSSTWMWGISAVLMVGLAPKQLSSATNLHDTWVEAMKCDRDLKVSRGSFTNRIQSHRLKWGCKWTEIRVQMARYEKTGSLGSI